MAGSHFLGAYAAIVSGEGAVEATRLGDIALVIPSRHTPAGLPDLVEGLFGSRRCEALFGSMIKGDQLLYSQQFGDQLMNVSRGVAM